MTAARCEHTMHFKAYYKGQEPIKGEKLENIFFKYLKVHHNGKLGPNKDIVEYKGSSLAVVAA